MRAWASANSSLLSWAVDFNPLRNQLRSCLLGLLLLSSCAFAQSGITAYERGDFEAARRYIEREDANPAEADFLRAALEPNGGLALEMYQLVVLKYPESPFSQRALERIRQYYIAQGAYQRADEIARSLKKNAQKKTDIDQQEAHPATPLPDSQRVAPPPSLMVSDNNPSPKLKADYSLQVGAFSRFGNAQRLKDQLARAGYTCSLLPPERSGNGLFTVRVVGFNSETAASAAAQKLQREFRLKPIIVLENQ